MSRVFICAFAVAFANASELFAQTTTDTTGTSTTGTSTTGTNPVVGSTGINQPVGTSPTGTTTTITPTTPATAGGTTTGTTTGTTGTGGTTPLTPFNESSNLISYNNMKTQTQTFQAAAGSSTAAASTTTTTAESVFKTAFLIPFIQNFFTQLQLFLATVFTINATSGGGGPSTSSPA